MSRFIVPIFLPFLVTGALLAADPATTGSPTKTRPSSASRTGSYFERAAAIAEEKREIVRMVAECLVLPQPDVAQFARGLIDPAEYRMSRLLNESEDLAKAREEMHRFWMNNQPSVLTKERLNGAIGP
ncbi:MAG TPA: hypothetical protein VKD71_13725 [Gemmataceae bacterium]|nr:hypothetical protein [Gemmataceae bacterium]